MRIVPVVALLAAVVASCAGTPGGEPSVTSGPATVEGHWVLEAGSADGRPIPLLDGHRITLSVERRQVGGTAACNHYGGQLELGGLSFRITEVGQTAMACQDPVMASELAYMAALDRIEAAAIDGGRLVLSGPGTELRFAPREPAPVAELVGTGWVLESLVEGEVAAAAAGDPATLTLGGDGTLAASTGCRTLSGRYVVSGDELTPTQLSAEGECPAGLAEQDSHVISVFEGFTAQVDGDRLTLTGRGNIGLVYRAAE